MKNDICKWVVTCPLLLLAGCSASLNDYRDVKPELKLNQFFDGQLEAYGIVQGWNGKVLRRFKADIRGEWKDNQGILDEQFLFADGERQHRCWRLIQDGDQYTGTAGDVVGEAEGSVSGNALNWQYQLEVPVDGKNWEIDVNDWMFLVDENNLINRATMGKFGVQVGEITLYLRKVSEQPQMTPTPGCSFEL